MWAARSFFSGCSRLVINRMLVYVLPAFGGRINEVNSSAKSAHFLLSAAFQRGFST
jgi:hypothetical protein